MFFVNKIIEWIYKLDIIWKNKEKSKRCSNGLLESNKQYLSLEILVWNIKVSLLVNNHVPYNFVIAFNTA